MMQKRSSPEPKKIVGRVERVSFPSLGINRVPAKIDTGADLSSIWASDIHEKDGILKFKLFNKKSEFYNGQDVIVEQPHYLLTRIANSFGHREVRYVVKLQVKIGGKVVRSSFTLSNRSNKTYPILIGRKLLNNKFLVDVSKGTPLKEIEDKKRARLQKEMEVFKMWEKKA
jgi:hypothetical protein